MCWQAPGEEPAVKTIILDGNIAAKRTAKQWVRDKEGQAGSDVRMWWTDSSRTDDGRVGAPAVCSNGYSWTVFPSYLGTGRIEVFDAELWAIRIALQKSVARPEALKVHGVTRVAIVCD